MAAEQLSTEALEAVARAKNLTPLGERSASPPGGRRTVTRARRMRPSSPAGIDSQRSAGRLRAVGGLDGGWAVLYARP